MIRDVHDLLPLQQETPLSVGEAGAPHHLLSFSLSSSNFYSLTLTFFSQLNFFTKERKERQNHNIEKRTKKKTRLQVLKHLKVPLRECVGTLVRMNLLSRKCKVSYNSYGQRTKSTRILSAVN